jgi:hypothetical protein
MNGMRITSLGPMPISCLQNIYGERAMLAVVCISASYGGKPWTLAEHTAIRERVSRSRASDSDTDRLGVLPIRVGEGDVKGIPMFTAIVPDVRNKPLVEIVELIVSRLHLLAPFAGASPVHPPPWPKEPARSNTILPIVLSRGPPSRHS